MVFCFVAEDGKAVLLPLLHLRLVFVAQGKRQWFLAMSRVDTAYSLHWFILLSAIVALLNFANGVSAVVALGFCRVV